MITICGRTISPQDVGRTYTFHDVSWWNSSLGSRPVAAAAEITGFEFVRDSHMLNMEVDIISLATALLLSSQ